MIQHLGRLFHFFTLYIFSDCLAIMESIDTVAYLYNPTYSKDALYYYNGVIILFSYAVMSKRCLFFFVDVGPTQFCIPDAFSF